LERYQNKELYFTFKKNYFLKNDEGGVFINGTMFEIENAKKR
jgi:hypothetical protein